MFGLGERRTRRAGNAPTGVAGLMLQTYRRNGISYRGPWPPSISAGFPRRSATATLGVSPVI